MTYINITKFQLINELEKYHSMIETRCLKNVVIFIETICILPFIHVYIHNHTHTYHQVVFNVLYSLCGSFLFWFFKSHDRISSSNSIFILNTLCCNNWETNCKQIIILFYNPCSNRNECQKI